jgi:hypothetical protein
VLVTAVAPVGTIAIQGKLRTFVKKLIKEQNGK